MLASLLSLAVSVTPGPGQQVPTVDFDATPRSGFRPLVVHFEDRSQGAITSWTWDFGDGSVSHERHPVHVFEQRGSFDVQLSVSGPASSAARAKPDFVRVQPRATPRPVHRPNLVLVVLDDVGVDRLGFYGEVPAGVVPPCTPSLDALAAQGLVFRQAYTNPLCSPSRAQLLTGRNGFRTGIGTLVSHGGNNPGLSALHEEILPEVLSGYDSSAVGKWHLASPGTDTLQHPLDSGFQYFAGSMANLGAPPTDYGLGLLDCSSAGPSGYHNWVKVFDSTGAGLLDQACTTSYATTDTVDEAIGRVTSMRSPWFLYVAFNAVHLPLDPVPPELCPAGCPTSYCASPQTAADASDALLEGLDTELGRLLRAIDALAPETYVFVIGDNGSDGAGTRGAAGSCFTPDHSKGTLYQGGIRVPLIAAGPGVVPGTCDALVSSVDLFATLTQLARVVHPTQDSVSMLPYLLGDRTPRRATVYNERFVPNFVTPDSPDTPPFAPIGHIRAVQNQRFKLIRSTDPMGQVDDELYDLELDPCEQADLCPGTGPCDPLLLPPLPAAQAQALLAELASLGVD